MIKFVLLLLVLSVLAQSNGCDSGCTVCSNGNCTACRQLFYLSDNTCKQCSPNCVACTASNNCQSCVAFYYSDGVSCKQCGSGCIACINNTTCGSCASGYYIDGGVCKACKSPCQSCSSSTVCLYCFTDNYLTNSTCAACPKYCSQCLNQQGCTVCKSGYYLAKQTCLPCQSNCRTCSSSNPCISCISGYFLVNNVCLPCNKNCSSAMSQCVKNQTCPAAAFLASSSTSTSGSSYAFYTVIPFAIGIFLLGCLVHVARKNSEKQGGKETSTQQGTIQTVTSEYNPSERNMDYNEDIEERIRRKEDVAKLPDEVVSIETN